MTVNGEGIKYKLNPDTPLLWALRDASNLTGAKYGCDKPLVTLLASEYREEFRRQLTRMPAGDGIRDWRLVVKRMGDLPFVSTQWSDSFRALATLDRECSTGC